MKKEEDYIDILDVGSRGGIPDEWDWFLKNSFKLRVNTFDIDKNASLEKKDNILYLNHRFGLSSSNHPRNFIFVKKEVSLHALNPTKI